MQGVILGFPNADVQPGMSCLSVQTLPAIGATHRKGSATSDATILLLRHRNTCLKLFLRLCSIENVKDATSYV